MKKISKIFLIKIKTIFTLTDQEIMKKAQNQSCFISYKAIYALPSILLCLVFEWKIQRDL